MNITDIKRLIRVYRKADEVGLPIMSCSIQRGLMDYAHGKRAECKERLEESVRFCEIAMHGTQVAQEFAPGAKAILKKILEKI